MPTFIQTIFYRPRALGANNSFIQVICFFTRQLMPRFYQDFTFADNVISDLTTFKTNWYFEDLIDVTLANKMSTQTFLMVMLMLLKLVWKKA